MQGPVGQVVLRLGAAIAAIALLVAVAFRPDHVAAQATVDLELVLAVDVSGSMDAEEHRVQREGYLAAIVHDDVLNAIASGPQGRIAVTYVEWAGDGLQVVVMPWRIIADRTSAEAFAAELAVKPISPIRRTSISSAIEFTRRLFGGNGFDGLRRVIDISGDGPNNSGPPVVERRDAALAQGIVINGLPIMIRPSMGWMSGATLDAYYADCVIGGPGSFVLPVHDTAEMAASIRRKLVLDIAGLPDPAARLWRVNQPRTPVARTPVARTPVARTPVDCMIGERARDWFDR